MNEKQHLDMHQLHIFKISQLPQGHRYKSYFLEDSTVKEHNLV